MTADLFAGVANVGPTQVLMAEGAVLLRGFVGSAEAELIAVLRDIVVQAPFRHMVTPGGRQM